MWFLTMLLLAGVIAQSAAQGFDFHFDKHICAVCAEMERGYPCDLFNACRYVNAENFKTICAEHCPKPSRNRIQSSVPDVRVTKGFGTKSYDQIRISVITTNSTAPVLDFFDYSQQFQHKWSDKYLHSTMRAAAPGKKTTFNVGPSIDVSLPAQGAGVAGVLIADPCIHMKGQSLTTLIGCKYGKKYKTNERTVELINTFVPDESTDFWGILGDNFYDRTGEVSAHVFDRISLEAKSKLFLSVAGNHDYWILGAPEVSTTFDQCGNGYMQFYAQDTKAAEFSIAGNSSAPFDFSVDPDKDRWFGLGCNKPAMENFFWYNQIGNVGIVGQSGAYDYNDAKPFMREACAWLSKQPGLDVAVLIGHWDFAGLGADPTMTMPQWYTEMAALPGCKEFENRGMLKFIQGHTHCNDPHFSLAHPHHKNGTGFRVAGFGMEPGCGNYGMPLVDTTEDRVRFWYFDTDNDDKYHTTIDCVKSKGWRQCTQLATLWLDQPINKSANMLVV